MSNSQGGNKTVILGTKASEKTNGKFQITMGCLATPKVEARDVTLLQQLLTDSEPFYSG